jgi:hypothetical protein
MARKKKEPELNQDVENYVISLVTEEVATAETNRDSVSEDFDTIVDMFEGKRPVKDYEWYSNLSMKEATSIILTDCSNATNQYFQTRDFVEVHLEGDREEDEVKARAAKKCINKTLNNRRLYHYQKFNRAKLINNMSSHVYLLCQWNQNIENKVVGTERKWINTGTVDEFGEIVWQPEDSPIEQEVIKLDHFDYDVFDGRNVFVSDEYTYSIQQKRYITFRSEATYSELKSLEKSNGYINLDIVKGLSAPNETETKRVSSKLNQTSQAKKTPIQPFDLYTRFGKVWAIVEEKDVSGLPIKIKPGYDKDGNILEEAELVESIICWVISGSNKVMVRFDATPYIDSNGNPYRPIVRGICYPHPTKDTGLGEGELLLDLNAGIDDAFNLAMDRVKLATIPVTISDKFAAQDNDTIFFEPGHNIAIEGGKKAFDMLQVEDNIQGMAQMIGMMLNKTEQVTATFPSTMGNLSGISSSTTATAFTGTENRASSRQNYKAITFEYTCLDPFYWIILQMFWQFARPQTALQMLGEDAYSFDPDADYSYSPVTSSIETEYNKYRKVQMLQQLLATIAPIPNPKTPEIMNKLMTMIFDTLGPDYNRANKVQFDTSKQSQVLAMGGGGGSASQPMVSSGASNQNGQMMSLGEMGVRDTVNGNA